MYQYLVLFSLLTAVILLFLHIPKGSKKVSEKLLTPLPNIPRLPFPDRSLDSNGRSSFGGAKGGTFVLLATKGEEEEPPTKKCD